MPRLRQVSRNEVTDPIVRYIYDRKYGDRDPVAQPGTPTGAPGNWETVFAQVPEIFEHAMRGFKIWQSPGRELHPILRELAVTRVGWVCGSQFVFSQHCKGLRGEGGSEAQIAALPHWQVADVFSPAERTVLAYVDCLALAHGRVAEGLFGELRKHLSEPAIIELTYVASMYIMHAGMTRAFRLEFDDRDDPIVEVPAPAGYSYRGSISPMNLPQR